MSRPGKKITLRTIKMHKQKKELELKDRSSKSLLANVLDMDDDFRQMGGGGASSAFLHGMSASTLDDTVSHLLIVAARAAAHFARAAVHYGPNAAGRRKGRPHQ